MCTHHHTVTHNSQKLEKKTRGGGKRERRYDDVEAEAEEDASGAIELTVAPRLRLRVRGSLFVGNVVGAAHELQFGLRLIVPFPEQGHPIVHLPSFQMCCTSVTKNDTTHRHTQVDRQKESRERAQREREREMTRERERWGSPLIKPQTALSRKAFAWSTPIHTRARVVACRW